jgi:tetratricopeptide (TPR) repeat protein
LLPHDLPDEIDGRFRISGDRIAGGMGMVYRGTDLSNGETVAVKISAGFGSQLGERFQQEANCLATIVHPAIVRYIAHGRTTHGEHYLVMEWLEGETLEDRLARGALSMGATVRMVRRVTEALAVAHQHGVIHRDIKPANIFLPDKDISKIKLLDFGIARRLFDPASMRLTQAGSALGTPMYMSPEQAQGSLDVDARADIFSLGCVFFECVTGTPPFLADSATGMMARLAGEDTLDLESRCIGVPTCVTDLLRRMLAKKPAERPATMAEVLGVLGDITEVLRTTGIVIPGARPRRLPVDAAPLMATGERRLAAVIVLSPRRTGARLPQIDLGTTADLGNLLARRLSDAELDDSHLNQLSRDVAAFGASMRRLANGSFVVTLTAEAQSTPLDLAVRAARCGLKVKLARPDSSIGVCLGHATKEDELRTEHLVSSAVRLVSNQHLGSIHINDELKRLLDARFEIVVEPDGRARLLFEKGLREAPKTVLGKDVPCLGRDREIRELHSQFEAAIEDEQARVLMMTGPAGCGKSRVAYEFLERLRDRGQSFELLISRGDPMRINVSLGLVAQALRGAAGINGTEPDDVQCKRLLAHTARFLPPKSAPTTAAFLGEIANIHFPDADLPQLQAARRDARLMADQTRSAWVDWLEAESEHHPVFLLLEDLHWGDFASVNYIDAALRVLRNKPLMVLGLARPEVDDRFFGMWRDRHPHRMSIPPLGKRAGQDFVRNILGDVSEEIMEWLLDHAQGNPFYLEELVRAVATNGDLSQIPDTVLDTVRVRFDAVGEGSKLVLRAASVFGQSFTADGVKALVGEMHDEDVDRWLEILVAKEILFTRPVGASRQHVFRHGLLHQAAYAMLSPKEEVDGHYLAGDFLEEAGERDAIVLADHFEKGQKPARAVRWLRVAANQAMEVDDLKAALERVERGVRLGAQGDDLAELRVVESEARYWKGEYVEAERSAREGMKCEDPKLQLRAISALVSAIGPQTKNEEIAELYARIKDRPTESTLLIPWLNCQVDFAAFLARGGRFEARVRTLLLLEKEKDNLDVFLNARTESMRAHAARTDGRPADYAQGFSRSAQFYEQSGHTRVGAEALGNAAFALCELGQYEEAEAHMRKLLSIAERMGLDHLLGGIFYGMTTILTCQGEIEEARSFGARALQWTAANNDSYFGSYTTLYLSVTEYLAGGFVRAEEYARESLKMVANNPGLLPFARALLARALLKQQSVTDAMSMANDAYCALEAVGTVADGEMTIRLAMAECLVASSEIDSAKTVIEKALTRLSEQVRTIGRTDWRESFLKKIPEHLEILSLAMRLGLDPIVWE